MTNHGPAKEPEARNRDEVVYVLTHTHWDREWYLQRGGFANDSSR